MYRLIARVLVVFTLLANLGWAADTYILNDSVFGPTALSAETGDGHADCSAGNHCHHYCHAAAHMLTIPGNGLTFHLAAGHPFPIAVDNHLHSFIPAPPFQPPRV